MSYRKIIQTVLILVASFQLLGCQEKGAMTDETHEAILRTKGENLASEYQRVLDHFYFLDSNPGYSWIVGTHIPEPFKEIKLPPVPLTNHLPPNLLPKKSPHYIQFVEELNIKCDGKIEYTKRGKRFEITHEELIDQIKWRPLKLSLCGSLIIPEGQKLQINVRNETTLQDFDLTTSPNSVFSLDAVKTEYLGSSPKVTIAPNSFINLLFI